VKPPGGSTRRAITVRRRRKNDFSRLYLISGIRNGYSNIDGALSADACKIANVFAEAFAVPFFLRRVPLPPGVRTQQKLLQSGHSRHPSVGFSPSNPCAKLRPYAVTPFDLMNFKIMSRPAAYKIRASIFAKASERAKPARRRIPCMCADRGVQVQVLSRKPNTRRESHAENSSTTK